MKLMNRELQREILEQLAATYPEAVEPHTIGHSADSPAFNFNAQYLAEHGLIDAKSTQYLGVPSQIVLARITAKGLDFLQDDGGLGAVLSVVTVRLEAETLRQLIARHVDQADLPPEAKSKAMQWLKTAGSDALKEATQRLVTAALDRLPDALQLLPKLID